MEATVDPRTAPLGTCRVFGALTADPGTHRDVFGPLPQLDGATDH